ncbi:hypothetical protein BA939_17370 [Rhizobium sp. S41]|nr:hypothetical protein BA939_17370 [Rhizobium sp. S41]KGE80915.1 hypothetical protein LW14_20780 [Rhizobium sp. H41]
MLPLGREPEPRRLSGSIILFQRWGKGYAAGKNHEHDATLSTIFDTVSFGFTSSQMNWRVLEYLLKQSRRSVQ